MNTVVVEQNVAARMRDGVTLYADVYRPSEPGPYPVLLTRSPYGKDMALANQGMHMLRAVRAGYVVIVQDCRGTFSSEGEFEYCSHEGKDGYDTIEWAATLPYSTGAVGMFGFSHLGWTQWSAAGLRPPHLRAIAPGQTWSDFSGMRFRGGAFELGDALQWRLQMSMGKLTREFTAVGRSPEEIKGIVPAIVAYMDNLNRGGFGEVPLRHLKSLAGIGLSEIIGALLDLGPGNQAPGFGIAYFDVEVPSLNIAGWYDVFQQYTIDNFVASRARGRGAARQSHLLVGPWTHGGLVAPPGTMVGEMNFGMRASAVMMDLTGIHLRWFDHWLKGIDNGIEDEAPVRLYLTGENRWVDVPEWPSSEAQEKRLYLGTDGRLGFSIPETESSATSFIYDPEHPAPTLGGNVMLELRGVRDQRPLSDRQDVLTFKCAPLEDPLKIMGRIRADLWVSSTAPDTDFVVRLIDIHPDGYMQNLCDGILRARYRRSLNEIEWLEPGEVYEMRVDMWSIAHVFKRGHGIAVQISSSSFPRWDRNWNTKDDPCAATSGESARNTIWHNALHPSCVLLQVMAD